MHLAYIAVAIWNHQVPQSSFYLDFHLAVGPCYKTFKFWNRKVYVSEGFIHWINYLISVQVSRNMQKQLQQHQGADSTTSTMPDSNGTIEYPTRITKFQNVYNLTLFFPSNFGADETRIYKIYLKVTLANIFLTLRVKPRRLHVKQS